MKIGIAGYGNLGRSLELLANSSDDVELVGVFTRRKTDEVKTYGADVMPFSSVEDYVGKIDVLCLCQGSSSDLPVIAPTLAKRFNTVDTYDNHKDADALGTIGVVVHFFLEEGKEICRGLCGFAHGSLTSWR